MWFSPEVPGVHPQQITAAGEQVCCRAGDRRAARPSRVQQRRRRRLRRRSAAELVARLVRAANQVALRQRTFRWRWRTCRRILCRMAGPRSGPRSEQVERNPHGRGCRQRVKPAKLRVLTLHQPRRSVARATPRLRIYTSGLRQRVGILWRPEGNLRLCPTAASDWGFEHNMYLLFQPGVHSVTAGPQICTAIGVGSPVACSWGGASGRNRGTGGGGAC